MFYRLQYNIATDTYGDLITCYFLTSMFSQLILVPFLSKRLQIRDTTIIIWALFPAILGFFLEAFLTRVIFLFITWSLVYILYINIFTTTRSALTKLVDSTEVGKLFTTLAILNSILQLISKPFYGFLYQATVDIYPPIWIFVSQIFLLIPLILIIINHVGMKRTESQQSNN